MKLYSNNLNPISQTITNFLDYNWYELAKTVAERNPGLKVGRVSGTALLDKIPEYLYLSVENDNNLTTVKKFGMNIPTTVRMSDGTINFTEVLNFIIIGSIFRTIIEERIDNEFKLEWSNNLNIKYSFEEENWLVGYFAHVNFNKEEHNIKQLYKLVLKELESITDFAKTYESSNSNGVQDAIDVVVAALRVSGLADSEKRIKWLNNLGEKLDNAS